MKVYVITDESGSIVGPARHIEESEAGGGPFGARPLQRWVSRKSTKSRFQTISEQMMKSPKEFHQELAQRIKARGTGCTLLYTF